ncbi:MAG: hypothetical protein KJO07_10370, partial [Deltaproteobacteria bacterium]|nr:hypothetical protein [Deltaproteobacteria bacterium]
MRKVHAVIAPILGLSFLACGGDDPGSVTVSLSFPSSASEANTATVHVYVLEPNRADNDEDVVGCPELVGDVLEPLSSKFGLRGDVVIRFDGGEGTTTAEIDGLDRGRALI